MSYGSGDRSASGFIGIDFDMFFDRPAIKKLLDDNTHKVFSTFGAYVRREAKKSIKKQKRKPVSQLTKTQKALYRQAKENGAKDPRPFIHSNPGEPPRYHPDWKDDGIRKIVYLWDRSERSVTIQTVPRGNSNVPSILEHGGKSKYHGKPVNVEARPFIWPAYERKESQLPGLWDKYGRR